MAISEQTFYRWKQKYGGLGVSELCRLRQLDEENRRLKRMVADLSLFVSGGKWYMNKASQFHPWRRR
jgi:hypothetical protein